MELFDVLKAVSVINRDDGERFTETGRIDAIAPLLRGSRYKRVNEDGLFVLYAPRSLSAYYDEKVVFVTSHVDCHKNITRCFSEDVGGGMMRGTYDNAVTNAAITYLMMENALPDDVLVAFTGDEEEDSEGVIQAARFLLENGVEIRHAFVLDVTDMGWEEEADFTIENDFWDRYCGQEIVDTALLLPYEWRFVPGDLNNVPNFVPEQFVIREEAEADESWDLDEYDIYCCSFCLPVKGRMHSDKGVLARKSSFLHYTAALARILLSC